MRTIVLRPPHPCRTAHGARRQGHAREYLTQLIKGYSLTLSEQALAPYVAARTNIKGSAEYPRWLRAFVNSAQMIWREPVVYEIPLLPQSVLFVMGENDHLAPGRDFAPEDRGEMGTMRATRKRWRRR